jgi:hypothetical protein
MTPKQFHQVVMSFPEVEESSSYGQPAYKAFGKFLTRLRSEDASCVLGCVDFDEREMLCAADPATFHFTDHYKSHPYVLARIAKLDSKTLRGYLTRQWRKNAPRRWLARWDAELAGSSLDVARSASRKNKPPRR